MKLPHRFVGLLLAFTALPAAAGAQDTLAGVLARARNALSDLRYAQADSLAATVLLLGDAVPAAQRIVALQIAAAARYPEDPEFQRAEGAASALRELVRMGHTAPVPPDVSWPGLDSLFAREGGMLPASAAQSGTSAVLFFGAGGTGPTYDETSQWLRERLPQFAAITWRDSGAVAVQAAAERVYSVDVESCVLQYKMRRWSEDLVLDGGQSKNVRRTDSSFTVDLRSLDSSSIEIGATDVGARFHLPGVMPTRLVYLRAYQPGARRDHVTTRLVDIGFMRNDQARRVRGAIEHLIRLCQKEPF